MKESYLLGLLAKIKCSICSYQCENWYLLYGEAFFTIISRGELLRIQSVLVHSALTMSPCDLHLFPCAAIPELTHKLLLFDLFILSICFFILIIIYFIYIINFLYLLNQGKPPWLQCKAQATLVRVHSKLYLTSPPRKNCCEKVSPVGEIPVFTLIRTDTTLDLSQKAEKV